MPPGSSVNIVACLLGHESLFIVETSEDSELMTISRDDLYDAAKQHLLLFDTLKLIESQYFVSGKKHDLYCFDPNRVETESSSSQSDLDSHREKQEILKRSMTQVRVRKASVSQLFDPD